MNATLPTTPLNAPSQPSPRLRRIFAWSRSAALTSPLLLGACDRTIEVDAEITEVTRARAILSVSTEPSAEVLVDGKHRAVADDAGKATFELPMADLAANEKNEHLPDSPTETRVTTMVSVHKPSLLRKGHGWTMVELPWRPSLFVEAKDGDALVLAPLPGRCFQVHFADAILFTGETIAMLAAGNANATLSLGGASFTTDENGFGVWAPDLNAFLAGYMLGSENEFDVEVEGGESLGKLLIHLRSDCRHKLAHTVREAVTQRAAWPYASADVVARGERAQEGGERPPPARPSVLIVREVSPMSVDSGLLAPGRREVFERNDTPLAAVAYVAIERETGRRESNDTCQGTAFDGGAAGSARLIPVDTEITVYALPSYEQVASIPVEGGDGGCPDAFTDGEKIPDYASDETVMKAVWDRLPAP